MTQMEDEGGWDGLAGNGMIASWSAAAVMPLWEDV
jgi:hypothetical protein